MGKKLINSVLKAIKILEILSDYEDGIILKELAKKVKLNKSTVYYLIDTLKYTDFVKQNDENNKYSLGPKTLQIGNAYLNNLSLYKISLKKLENLKNKINENIYLTISEDLHFITIIKLESEHLIRPVNYTNERDNAHATAIGKVLLAFSDKSKLDYFLKNMTPLRKITKNTIIKIEDLKKELETVRKKKYAVDLEESGVGINCLAVPIFNENNEARAALGVSIPTQRFKNTKIDDILKLLRETSLKISYELGFSGKF